MGTQDEKKTATAKRPTPPEAKPTPDHLHEVKDGDTLDDIAKKAKTTPEDLQRLNGIKRPDLIWPGMQIRTA